MNNSTFIAVFQEDLETCVELAFQDEQKIVKLVAKRWNVCYNCKIDIIIRVMHGRVRVGI